MGTHKNQLTELKPVVGTQKNQFTLKHVVGTQKNQLTELKHVVGTQKN